MPKGVYAAASAMFTEQYAMDVVAENLANASTAGFKQSRLQRTGFAELLRAQGRSGPVDGSGGAGVAAASTWRDFSQGELQQTNAPLDLGLVGAGFFLVRDQQGAQLLTRAGNFTLDDERRLVTPDGHPVQGQGGDIVIPEEVHKIIVDESGRIYGETPGVGGLEQTFIEQVRVVVTDEPLQQRLTPRSGQVFELGNVPMADAEDTLVRQGFIEGSNVDPVGELVRMVSLQRRYDAAQRALSRQLQPSSFSDILRGNG